MTAPRSRRSFTAYAALALAALLFGGTFVVIKQTVTILPPMAFVGWRFSIGALALLLLALPRGAAVWKDGLLAGLLLFIGYALQTQGLALTSASNSGLITGFYVVLTPMLAALFGRRRVSSIVVAGSGIALVGLALLTLGDGMTLSPGDLLTLGCAVAFAAHIVVLSRVAARHPVIPFTAVQLLVTAVLALGMSAAVGNLPMPPTATIPALVGTGLVVSAGGFFLQVWSQTVVGPARTAIVLALEPAFATMFAAWLLAERLTARGWAGAAFILVGIYVVLIRASDDDPVPAAEAVTAAH